MKKILFCLALVFSVCSISLTANAVPQPKSSDYIIVPDTSSDVETVESVQTVPAQTFDNSSTVNYNSVLSLSSYYDSVTKMGKYLKVKKDDKYGVTDKDGNIILAPVFQRVSIINFEGQDCFAAKADGKYRLYYNTGTLIHENDLYPVVQNSSVLAEKELVPQFQAVIEKKEVVYTPIKKQTVSDNSNFVYEIKEIPLVKVKNTQYGQSVVASAVTNNTLNSIFNSKKDMFTVNKNRFYVVKENNSVGISNSDGEIIIPAVYDSFTVKTPGSSFNEQVFVMSLNNVYSVFDLTGKLLAEQVYDKINVYKNGKLYTYNEEEGKGVLREDGKILGYFTKDENGYKYSSARFSFFKPLYVNNLILTILNI